MTVQPLVSDQVSVPTDEDESDTAVRKVFRHLIPVLFICYVMAFLDRINFGFAAVQMNDDIGVTVTQFGIAGTIFYVTYFLAEIPSNLLMVRFGARRWIARIMITWGLASMGTALVTGPAGLYIARAILGLAEAGFVPGVLLYLTYWIPAEHRGRATALFMTAQPIAIALGSPLSGLILGSMDGIEGLQGWQWLFIIEAAPTVIFGVAVLWLLPDRPAMARWLTGRQSAALSTRLAGEPVKAGGHGVPRSFDFINAPFIATCAAYFALVASLSTLSSWSPLILKDIFQGGGALTIGVVAALPGIVAVIAMPLLSISSDKRQERAGHYVVASTVAAFGWCGTTLTGSPSLQVLGLVAATAAGFSAMPVLWTLPPTMLKPIARPVGIAVLSSSGILGSMCSPTINGILRDTSGSYVATGWLGFGCMIASALLIYLAVRLQRRV